MRFAAASFAVVVGATSTFAFQQGRKPEPIRDFSLATKLDDGTNLTANVSLGDLDGDGDLDMVLARGRHWDDSDLVLINDGKGKFTTRDLSPAKDSSYSATAIDVDGDKDLDVVVSNDSQPGIVYLNDGRGRFKNGGQWGAANWPTRNATLADLNGDGRPDVIAANRAFPAGRRSRVCLNDGAGQFKDCTELNVGPATSIVPADFDRDGHVDLAVPHRDGGQSLILYNDGKAGFARTKPVGSETSAARTAAAGDLTGDGWPDLVIGDEQVGSFIYLNDGRGTLQKGLLLTVDELMAPYSMTIGDLNRDGAADIVVGYAGHRGSVFFNMGNGRSFRHVRFGDDEAAIYGIAVGDLDGDGYPEIVSARSGAPNVVFFNRSGLGVDVVEARDLSTRASRPLPDSSLGMWSGIVARGSGSRYQIDVGLDDGLWNGTSTGITRRRTNGVTYCVTRVVLKERLPNGVYRFTEKGQEGCAWIENWVDAKWTDDDHLQWETWTEGTPARVTATLTRDSSGRPQPFAAAPPNASNPVLGVWHGEARMVDDAKDVWRVDLKLDQLEVGKTAGSVHSLEPSPSGRGELAYCPARLTLKERRADGTLVLTATSLDPVCNDDEWVISPVQGDQLRVEWFWGAPGKPSATATLQRKR